MVLDGDPQAVHGIAAGPAARDVVCHSSRGRAHPSPSTDEAGGGLRRGGLLGGLQEGAEVFQFSDQAVLDGGHLVGAVALALEVRPVTSRTLFGLGQFGFQFGDPCLECGDRLGDRLVTSR